MIEPSNVLLQLAGGWYEEVVVGAALAWSWQVAAPLPNVAAAERWR